MKSAALFLTAMVLACHGTATGDEKKNPKQYVEELLHKSREAKEAGRPEESQKLHEQAERFMAEMKKREEIKKPQSKEGEKHKETVNTEKGGKTEGAKFVGKGPEMEKLHHLSQAAEHLHVADMHEQAEDLDHAVMNMKREIEERMKREQAEVNARKEHGGETPRAEIEEMRRQMRKIAEQIERLQDELKRRNS